MKDLEIKKLIRKEAARQTWGIELIASENYVSKDVMEAMGSILTNKYAEGYPGHRYYGGCEVVDEVENLAISRLCQLFDCEYANVQPHSGSQANRAAIEACCNVGDTILSLDLDCGGHLTHGSPVSFSGMQYNIVSYHLDAEGFINYDEMEALALEHKPVLIIGGASAYSQDWDFKRMRQIADKVGALIMFDMAHIAGPIAAGLLENPCKWADIVTATTHKTLRGPRGGIILLGKDFTPHHKVVVKKSGVAKTMAEMINSSVFPGNQGGPLEHIIAAKAVCFREALQPEFVEYQKNVLANSAAMAQSLMELGFKIVSGGTINHEFLVDLRQNFPDMTGKEAERILGENCITVNKNMVANDSRKPHQTSGIRIGSAAVSSRGFNADECRQVADLIYRALLKGGRDASVVKEVKALCRKHRAISF